ncbi:MAG: hypothetical protein ACRCWR_07160, partial [Saezia sp.]
KRTAEELTANCKHWPIPESTDADANNWYRAATSIHAINLRTVEQHQKMLQLYEAAARRGHYNATKNLTILYMSSNLVMEARFKPDPEKARYWLEQAIRQHRWVGALEWVPHIMASDGSGLSERDYKRAYFQQAADMGVALAQFALSSVFQPSPQEEALLICAADQGFGSAAHEMGTIYEVRKKHEEALHYYQIAVMNGNEAGGGAAYALQTFWYDNEAFDEAFGDLRSNAYRDIKDALGGTPSKYGNYFYRFPRLNEVLPLPPAKITEWKGIYSAMSEDDATYYQNPPPVEFYLKQVQEAGLLIPIEYLAQPWHPKEGESLF